MDTFSLRIRCLSFPCRSSFFVCILGVHIRIGNALTILLFHYIVYMLSVDVWVTDFPIIFFNPLLFWDRLTLAPVVIDFPIHHRHRRCAVRVRKRPSSFEEFVRFSQYSKAFPLSFILPLLNRLKRSLCVCSISVTRLAFSIISRKKPRFLWKIYLFSFRLLFDPPFSTNTHISHLKSFFIVKISPPTTFSCLQLSLLLLCLIQLSWNSVVCSSFLWDRRVSHTNSWIYYSSLFRMFFQLESSSMTRSKERKNSAMWNNSW
jgi:hypothetical protein